CFILLYRSHSKEFVPKLLGSFFSWTTKELMGIIFFNNFPTVHKNNMMGYISSKTYLIKLIKNSI
ncbi:TPA: hypothetical protein ACOZIC_001858, partial [Streptococcus pneumoniae]